MKIFPLIILLYLPLSSLSQVVIHQFYGAGGNSGAIYNDDYIVLANTTAAAVSINGWSVQYASSTGSSWDVLNLPNFSIPANGFYFICLATSNTVGASLTGCDLNVASSTLGSSNSISASSGKIALVNNTTALAVSNPVGGASIIDFVGYGSANAFEGGGAAPSPSNNSQIITRNSTSTDTNNNNIDFSRNGNLSTGAFPVELLSFNAKSESKGIQLLWNTTDELNNEGFEVQRSTDAISFEGIGFVKGQNQASAYDFFDLNPKSGINYYRLKQQDFDGNFKYSKIIDVFFNEAGSFSVYPNPAGAQDPIKITGLNKESSLTILNEKGQLLHNTITSDKVSLPSGVYFLKVTNPYQVESKKLVVY